MRDALNQRRRVYPAAGANKRRYKLMQQLTQVPLAQDSGLGVTD